ncbi:hypothetical protein Pelo_787 [Pelomyxa schiedti]|nr:hypothetical protein Pelo_787 [Pelomyxa schiedti]
MIGRTNPSISEVKVSLRARQQLHALVMASHNRCGVSSPARHFVSLPPLATAPLWDWCLHDSEVVFAVSVALSRQVRLSSCLCYFTFGVSCALMGVTREFKLHNHWPWSPVVLGMPIPISPSLVIVPQETEDTFDFSLVDVVTQQNQLLLTTSWRTGLLSARSGNKKWWVHCEKPGKMTIVRLIMGAGCGISTTSFDKVGIDISSIQEENLRWCGVSFSIGIPDEAVLFVCQPDRKFNCLVVIDVETTYRTKKLAVLSSTKCLQIQGDIEYFIFMKKSTGERSFFVVEDLRGRTVHEVVETVGEISKISSQVQTLSQLSSSLFCITKIDGSSGIWDCNNTSAPVRVISARRDSDQRVVQFPEFIFHKRQISEQESCVEVYASSSTRIIATLSFRYGTLRVSAAAFI